MTGYRVDHIRSGYRRFAVGSHLIFFRHREDSQIEIVRVLHRRMDAAKRPEEG